MKYSVKKLTIAALIIATDIIVTRFLSYMMPGGFDRLSLQFVPHALAGYIFGPYGAAGICLAGDILGMLTNSGGFVFNPLYSLSAVIRGIIYGFMLYKKTIGFRRVFISVLLVTFIVDLGMNPVWSMLMYGRGWLAVMAVKLPVRLITIPVYGIILYGFLNSIKRAVPKL